MSIKKRIEKIIGRNHVFSILLVCTVVLTLASISWTIPSEKVVKTVKGYEVEKGFLKHEA